MKVKIFILFVLAVAAGAISLSGCESDRPHQIDQEVFVPVKDNCLYLRLSGNSAGPIILMLHGGPGGSAGFDRYFYKPYMEARYLMGYLDQRGSGKSPAASNKSLVNMQQFVADIDRVVDYLHRQYPNQSVHLLGGSWGGTLGFLYLLSHQQKIRSFICVSGKIDGQYENRVLIDHESQLAGQQLAALNDPQSPVADSLRHVLSELRRIQEGDFNEFYQDVNLLKFEFPKILGFNPYWYDTAAQHHVEQLGKDTAFYAAANYKIAGYDSIARKGEFINKIFRNTPSYNHIDLKSELAKIHIPVAVIGGSEDYVVGPGHANLIYESLVSLDTSRKELHVFPGAAHNVNIEAEELYYPTILAFLEKHQ